MTFVNYYHLSLALSAAFDTIDHNILIERLKNMYGIDSTALNWFRSYLSNRTQSVLVEDSVSKELPMSYGVPQGSKLGPILFNSYIAPLSGIAHKHGVDDEKYADDEQLYLSFKPRLPNDGSDAVVRIENCIEEIRQFLQQNKLCNNSEKTEFLIIGTPQQLK